MIYRIRSYHGGLGDELQFSTFPEYLSELGHEVYLLKDSAEVLPFRNEGIKNFVWGYNPHIKGELAGEWNLGDLLLNPYKNVLNDYIKNWEVALHFAPRYSLPKVYYQAKHPLLSNGHLLPANIGLIELSAISLKYDTETVIKQVEALIKNTALKFYQVCNPAISATILIPGIPVLYVNNLESMSDLIFTCETFISLNSGTHSLAAAIRRQNPNFQQICILPKADAGWITEGRKFMYPGVEYV